MRAIVHIGTHKTGSTSLQQALFSNHDALLKQGVLYPTQYVKWSGHHELSWSLGIRHPHATPGLSPEAVLDAYFSNLQVDTVILSSEDFEFGSPLQVGNFLQLLHEYCDVIDVVCYFRHPAEYIESAYKQNVRAPLWRYGRSISEFIRDVDIDARVKIRERLDYVALFNRWNLPCVNRFFVRLYDRTVLPHGDVVADFCNIFELRGLDNIRRQNVSQRNLTALINASLNRGHSPSPNFVRRIDGFVRQSTHDDVHLLCEDDYQYVLDIARPAIERLLRLQDIPNGSLLLQSKWKPGSLTPDEALTIAVDAVFAASN